MNIAWRVARRERPQMPSCVNLRITAGNHNGNRSNAAPPPASGSQSREDTTMKTHWLVAVLTAVNFVLLVFSLARSLPAEAQNVPSVVRARAFELVDERGRVRATLNVQPATTANGQPYPESVLLRLITERGRPSVKISASEQSSGLSFAGPTGTEKTYVILEANGKTSSLTLKSEDGGERIVRP
jgi:hypothetical protein